MTLVAAGFNPPPKRQRPQSQDQNAPWANNTDRFTCRIVTTHLPDAADGFVWDHSTKAMNNIVGGVAYWRVADLRDGSVRTVQGRRTIKPEISVTEANRANDEIADFDNKMSSVMEVEPDEVEPAIRTTRASIHKVPASDEIRWATETGLCSAPIGN